MKYVHRQDLPGHPWRFSLCVQKEGWKGRLERKTISDAVTMNEITVNSYVWMCLVAQKPEVDLFLGGSAGLFGQTVC
jgi:hypothetical protein